MKLSSLRHRRFRRAVLATVVLPPALWCLVLAVVPLERSRRCVAERLSQASGRPVEIGGLRVGFLGGVSLKDLRIGAPDSKDDPWLKVGRASIDISLLQLLLGKIEPTRVDIDGLHLRALRRPDGELELSDFLAPSGEERPRPQAPEQDRTGAGLELTLRNGRISVIDEPTSTRLELIGIEGRASCDGHITVIEELRGTINGGPFDFSGQYARGGPTPTFEGRVHADNVSLRDDMRALAYLVPVFTTNQPKLEGRLSLDLYLTGEGNDRESFRRTLKGEGRVALDPIILDDSRLLAEFAQFVTLPPKGRVGAVRSKLAIRDGAIINDHLAIDVGALPVVLSGSTGFDGRINYRLRGDALTDRLPAKARNYLAELEIDLNGLADVRVQGTVDDMVVRVNGRSVGKNGSSGTTSEEGLREIGRRIRERVRR